MMSLHGFLSLFSALLATSSALSCTTCRSTNSIDCTGPNVTCRDDYLCGSAYQESIIGISETTTFTRSCRPISECNINGTLSGLRGQIRFISSCCSEDDCTPTLPECK
ncbi:hypothetical protein GDO81_028172 [Engystomops pustulosus]|uniref:Sodefrin-like factor n=1 Tax=Engystomops pustulosus TaxID=76066 RepID=A0AAV6ZV20_ENGPU|nr:hypothetical protein GDO81_028172 [Engystomops pustulosus]